MATGAQLAWHPSNDLHTETACLFYLLSNCSTNPAATVCPNALKTIFVPNSTGMVPLPGPAPLTSTCMLAKLPAGTCLGFFLSHYPRILVIYGLQLCNSPSHTQPPSVNIDHHRCYGLKGKDFQRENGHGWNGIVEVTQHVAMSGNSSLIRNYGHLPSLPTVDAKNLSTNLR